MSSQLQKWGCEGILGGFLCGSVVKNTLAKAGDAGHASLNGNPLQYSCLENPMDRKVWRTIVHGVKKSWPWLSDWACTHEGIFIPKEMATPTPVFLPGKSHGLRNIVGYSPWGHKELDTTEQLHFHFLSQAKNTTDSLRSFLHITWDIISCYIM